MHSLGTKLKIASGLGTRLKNDYPNTILWHCLNHHLQLILNDSVNDIKQVNHFKIFMDEIYTIFHQSNKNQMQLFKILEMLGQQIVKIYRILGPRWAACGLDLRLLCGVHIQHCTNIFLVKQNIQVWLHVFATSISWRI